MVLLGGVEVGMVVVGVGKNSTKIYKIV